MDARRRAIAIFAVVVGVPAPAFGQLQYRGPVDMHGTGFGAVSTIITVQRHPATEGSEAGCIGPTGAPNCPWGDTKPGNAHTNLYSISDIPGVTGSNLQLFLNFAEPGNDANAAILDNATLTLYNGSTPLFQSSTGTVDFPTTFTGTGQTGFVFALSPGDAALFDGFLSQPGSANYTLGLSTAFSDVSAGQETWFINTGGAPSTVTPEPSSMALLGTGLVGLLPLVRRKARA